MTEIAATALGRKPDAEVLFGARLVCVTRGENKPFDTSIPGFVRQIVEHEIVILDSRRLGSEPWVISSKEDVRQLGQLLLAPRLCDVVVFSLPDSSVDPAETAASAINVHRRTLGAAHVAIITGPASFLLTDLLGREFSVFRQAVRSYRPAFDPLKDQPFSHPLALADKIADWPDGGSRGKHLCSRSSGVYGRFEIGYSKRKFAA